MRIICPCCNEELTPTDRLVHINGLIASVQKDWNSLAEALRGRLVPESIDSLAYIINSCAMLSDMTPDPVSDAVN